ncbi:hypothetical protein [Caedibacter taeniospiralis]|uniref:hypothetical protein n=1 Tax=Caedibacter taeniospiralis TaxID=28907 RepID=UPI000C27ACB4|nr:hypothetical protein [Caedibacter taeniospiralis]
MSNYDFFEDTDQNKQLKDQQRDEHEVSADRIDDKAQPGVTQKLKQIKFEKIHLLYGVAGLIFLFGAYFVLGTLFGGGDNEPAKIKTQTKAVFNENAAFVKTQQPAVSAAAGESTIKRLNEMEKQFNSWNQEQRDANKRYEKTSIEIAQHIKKLESQQDELLKTIQSVVTALAEMKQSDQSKTLISLVAELQRQLQYMNAKEINMNEKLRLTAIIDGIAWLEDKKGRSFTIKEGSQLEGYGKVLKIDSQTYKVYTASGFVFE